MAAEEKAPLDIMPGQTIELTKLRNAAWLNGQKAEVQHIIYLI